MPIRRSPNGAVTPVHSLVAIARNGWSRSIGTTGRNQSESVVAISRYAQNSSSFTVSSLCHSGHSPGAGVRKPSQQVRQ